MRCPKCEGKGYINCYSHVARGICFSCNGSGQIHGGKRIEKITFAQLKHTLFGLNKRETKFFIDSILWGVSYYSENIQYIDKFVALGYVVKIANNRYAPAQYFTRASIDILIDWNK